jgi:hypothetical protein
LIEKVKKVKAFLGISGRKTILAPSGRELVQYEIHLDKPIPPASHGTVMLLGKQ